jgi:outer membrane protein TolC
VARYQYLPSFALDFAYGIDANQFTARTDYATPESGRGTLPDYLVDNRQNLGYSGQITLNIPLWNWGATRSKVKQAELRAEQAQSDLAMTQKQFKANVTSAYLEAQAAYDQIDSLRSSTDLSAESLRLTLLRYQAGEANILEVVDAQTTLAAARNAYADGLARYRVALANIETLAGHL